jgi:fructosamine-3-kinase
LVTRILERRGLPIEEVQIYEKLVHRIPDLVSAEAVPSLIHGDLWSGNFLYSQHGPALIDPACYYADREMELGMMQLFGGFSARVWSAYEEEWPLPAGWETRTKLYQLYHLLNHFLLFGGSYGREACETARRFL